MLQTDEMLENLTSIKLNILSKHASWNYSSLKNLQWSELVSIK